MSCLFQVSSALRLCSTCLSVDSSGVHRICKDPSRKFCPSCGNPSLLRTTTTTSSTGVTRIHLKKNFQYHLRGTKFTIPDAKPGRAKGQEKGGSGLILREDQREWMDAVRLEKGRVEKEERRLMKGTKAGWEDPDVSGSCISEMQRRRRG
jgi:RNA-binding protein NOB1